MNCKKIIFHVDANNFFASVETATKPELKDIPVAVTGNAEKRTGIVLAKNMLAKKQGVQTGETIWQAKTKCPDLVCVEPHHNIYEVYSKKLHAIYEQYTDKIEAFGIDECWLDMTETCKLYGTPEEIALKIRSQVKKDLNITVSIGISFCKLFAKLASDMKKPDGTVVINKDDLNKMVYPLSITEIIGIGSKLEKRFNKFNVFTLGDLKEIPDDILKSKFGIIGLQIKNAILGKDESEVAEDNKLKSVGNGTTTIIDIFTKKEVNDVVLYLSEKISSRMREKNLFANTITVSIKNNQLHTLTHSMAVDSSFNQSQEIAKNANTLINKFWKYDEKIRAIRISCSKLTKVPNGQISIFSIRNTKDDNKVSLAIDSIRKKYGKNAIELASIKDSKYINKTDF